MPTAMPIDGRHGGEPERQQHAPEPAAAIGRGRRRSRARCHRRRAQRADRRAARPSHFIGQSMSGRPTFLALAMISLTLAISSSSPLAMPTKQGRVLQQQLELGAELRVLLPSCCRRPTRRWRCSLHLAGDEGGDGRVVVLEALARRRRGRRDLGELLVLDARRASRRPILPARSAALFTVDRLRRRTPPGRTANRRARSR